MSPEQPTQLQKPTIIKREWWIVAVISVLAVAWSLVPTFTGLQQMPSDHQYLYTNIPDVVDMQVYFYNIDQNAQGRFFYRNFFTSEPHQPVFWHPLWLILGLVERTTGLSAPIVFTASRAVSAFPLLFTLYWFVSHWLEPGRWRLIGWLTAVFGSGLGGFALSVLNSNRHFISLFTQDNIYYRFPVDIIPPPGFPWMMIGHSPHNILAQTLILGILILIWRGRPVRQAGPLVLILGFLHPYDLAIVFGVLAAHALILLVSGGSYDQVKQSVRRLVWLFFWTIPVIIYYIIGFVLEPVLWRFYQQNFLRASNPLLFVAGFGVIAPLAVYGLWRLRKTADRRWGMIAAWAMSGLILYYLPFIRFQGKMLNGYIVPLALLAVVGLRALWPTLRSINLGRLAVSAALSLITFSTIIVFPLHVVASQKNEPAYHYAPKDLINGLYWIRANTPGQSIVLGDTLTGNLVPYAANRATYLGHPIQTINFARRLDQVRGWFFGVDGDALQKQEFLRLHGITHIVWGPYERRRGLTDPMEIGNLETVFTNSTVTIFAVID